MRFFEAELLRDQKEEENVALRFLLGLFSNVGTSSLVSDELHYVNPCCLGKA